MTRGDPYLRGGTESINHSLLEVRVRHKMKLLLIAFVAAAAFLQAGMDILRHFLRLRICIFKRGLSTFKGFFFPSRKTNQMENDIFYVIKF